MTKALINLLNRIANEFECEVVESNEFAYYYEENMICVTDEKSDFDEKFLELARKEGLNEEVGCFAISFFHELGHNETIDDVEEEFDGNKDEFTMEEYFYLEEEYLATEWAIDYCNENLDLVKKIQKMLDK